MARLGRRQFLGTLAAGATLASGCATSAPIVRRPNVVFVFADQLRAQATGYAGDPNARTPHLDGLARTGVQFTHAVSGCPVCSPYRASLVTGQYWLTHGVFLNDVCLGNGAVSIAEAFGGAGYDTAYIGKWHLDGHGRSVFIPRERRHGFAFWKVLECTHDYNKSRYYADDDVVRQWDGYDVIAQTHEARRYIREHSPDRPFALFLSWGPPHDPYQTAPEEFRRLFSPDSISLRPNVPAEQADEARKDLAGYYAHLAAMDSCVGALLQTLDETGLAQDTVFVFTSDHGDMLRSQGARNKQRPFDESIRVPFLLRYPARLGTSGRTVPTLLNAPDIMPTLLGLCGVPVPRTVEGSDFSPSLLGEGGQEAEAALLMCAAPFGQWTRAQGGREYRGVRTLRHTYVRDLNGPWLLYDNETDPYQMDNLSGRPEHARLQGKLDDLLKRTLAKTHDEFLPARDYIERWRYVVDSTGTVPYRD